MASIKVQILPEDVVAEILLRLPIESLIRFNSVCKYWRSLMFNRTFAELQLRRSKSQPRFILWHKDGCSISQLIMLEKPKQINTVKLRKISLEYNGYDDHGQKKMFDIHIIGSCNGLICKISTFPRRCCGLCHNICIYNPITKEGAVLPVRSDRKRIDSGIFGFGMDSTGTYKVIQIFKDWKGEIITVGESSWRELTGIPSQQLNHRSFEKMEVMVFMNGALYFIVQKTSFNLQPIMLMFDIHDEKFSIIEFPSSVMPRNLSHLRLTVIMDSIVIYQPGPSSGPRIWIIGINKSKNNSRYQQFAYVNRGNIPGRVSLVGMLNNDTFFFKVDGRELLFFYCYEEKQLLCIEESETNLRLQQTGNFYFVPSLQSPIALVCDKQKKGENRSVLEGPVLQVVGYSSLSEFMDSSSYFFMNSSSYLLQHFVRVKPGFCCHCGGKAQAPLGQVYQ